MIKCCVCYIANRGYLFSTLLSAMQARAHVSSALADVVIFNIGERGEEAQAVEAAAECSKISFVTIDPDILEGTHVALGRLFFARFAPENYQKFIYIDGDTQISQSLDPLLEHDLAPDRFLASRDPMALLSDRRGNIGHRHRLHWANIGLPETEYANYVNSGVLVAHRESWDRMSRIAIELYKKTPELYKIFRDQDVINIVGRGQVDLMSFRWNFPAFLMGRGYEEIVQPRIYHFMSNPRPWHGPFLPWGPSWHKPYLELEKRHPELARFRPKFSRLKYVKYLAQQRYKSIFERAWDQEHTRNMMKEFEQATVV